MSSAAKRRRERLARKRRFAQAEAKRVRLEDAKRCQWQTHILADWQKEPDHLVDVTPPNIERVALPASQ
jgi:hypothetical protein